MIAVEILGSLYEAMQKNKFKLRDGQREEVVSFAMELMEKQSIEFGEWLTRKMWSYSFQDKKWKTVNGAEAKDAAELYRMYYGEQLHKFTQDMVIAEKFAHDFVSNQRDPEFQISDEDFFKILTSSIQNLGQA